MTTTLIERLKSLADEGYKAFQTKLIPNISADTILGVRLPAIRAVAKEMSADEKEKFVGDLPHRYLEENLLHAAIIDKEKSFDKAVEMTEEFLPYVDNWAVSDMFSPACFAKHADELYEIACKWTQSDRLYTVRYGILCFKRYFLGEAFRPETLEIVSRIHGEYYLNMAAAWFFAEAVTKNPEFAIPYFEQRKLDADVMKKAVRKSLDSFRVPQDTKEYLKSLLRNSQ